MNLLFFINALTCSRILLAPLVLWPLFFPSREAWQISAFIFIALSFTDFLDGYLARKYNHVTDFGKLMDPLGDKILTLLAMGLLVHERMISVFILLAFIIRDLMIGTLRAYSASQNKVLAARSLGKFKTTFQMLALPLMLWPIFYVMRSSSFNLGYQLLLMSLALAYISFLDYLWLVLKNRN